MISALHRVVKEFIKNLDTLAWLDEPTKAKMKEKASGISYKVGYPDWIIDPQALDKYYEKV